MDQPYCETCAYWDLSDVRMDTLEGEEDIPVDQLIRKALEASDRVIEGECRRYPRMTPGRHENESTAEWPRTAHYDWCGEHPDFPEYLESLKTSTPES